MARPKGSKNLLSLRDYMTPKDIKTFFEFVVATYMESEKLTVFVGEHLMGKAPMNLGNDGEGNPIKGNAITFINFDEK